MMEHQIAHESPFELRPQRREELDLHLIRLYLLRPMKKIEMGEDVVFARDIRA